MAIPSVAAGGPGGTPATSAANRFVGVISAVYKSKGYGFIRSDEIFRQYGFDVFVTLAEIVKFDVRSTVSFDLVMNSKGQPQGRNLAHDIYHQDTAHCSGRGGLRWVAKTHWDGA